ncbi:MAG: NusG domain II-containing protein [Ruminococcus flavefaciens]|nr:NusG domain II-containing protein [Ruminococcus flavefaciens]MCM1361249.1 NusG domain II-containing protein [Clostridiales bacterium]MCM1435737.1 NusG domain II-containing protein [Ruminococcus flavefaciens]
MKSKKIWITVCIVIFLIGVAGSLWMIFKPHGQTVRIVQNGKTLYTIDLDHSADRTIEVEYQGSKNIIEIKNHRIYVKEAECPDQTCVKMGELKSSAAPIVCLPNKLVIEFTEDDDIDAEVK